MLDKFDIDEMVSDLQNLVEDADTYVEMGKTLFPIVTVLVNKFKPLAVEVLKVVLKEFADISEELEPEMARLSAIEAKKEHRNLDNYKAAGFTNQQAFALVLASLKPFDSGSILSGVIQGSSRSGK
jgi:hypothetical protein